jgi:hypothetical protein
MLQRDVFEKAISETHAKSSRIAAVAREHPDDNDRKLSLFSYCRSDLTRGGSQHKGVM